MARIAVIYYSATGNTYQVAQAVETGARQAGAETRLRKVRELAPDEAIATNQGWAQHVQDTGHILEAALDDLRWADGLIFGTPSRYGVMAAQLKEFIDSTGSLWQQGLLANKPVSAFTGAYNAHGGQETTLLSIYNVMYAWGAIIVPPGYTDPSLYAAGGNPYGVSYSTPQQGGVPEEVLIAARYLGGRVARFAAVLAEAGQSGRLTPTAQEARAVAATANGHE
jgi:NAD(P)H dehydrogenase (quinone)